MSTNASLASCGDFTLLLYFPEQTASTDIIASLDGRIRMQILSNSNLSQFLNLLLNQVWKDFFEDAVVEYLDPPKIE